MPNESFTLKEMLVEVREEQRLHHAKLDAIHTQALKTNGRVNKLEKNSIGLWIINNKVKAATTIISIFTLLISDSRDIIIGGLAKLIGL